MYCGAYDVCYSVYVCVFYSGKLAMAVLLLFLEFSIPLLAVYKHWAHQSKMRLPAYAKFLRSDIPASQHDLIR